MQTVSSSLQSQILHCDNLSLPFRDESVDAALSIAVIHHIATAERRVRALRELSRVLRVGGRVIISVWAMEQRHRKVSQCVCRSKEEGLTGLSKVTMSFYIFRLGNLRSKVPKIFGQICSQTAKKTQLLNGKVTNPHTAISKPEYVE